MQKMRPNFIVCLRSSLGPPTDIPPLFFTVSISSVITHIIFHFDVNTFMITVWNDILELWREKLSN